MVEKEEVVVGMDCIGTIVELIIVVTAKVGCIVVNILDVDMGRAVSSISNLVVDIVVVVSVGKCVVENVIGIFVEGKLVDWIWFGL